MFAFLKRTKHPSSPLYQYAEQLRPSLGAQGQIFETRLENPLFELSGPGDYPTSRLNPLSYATLAHATTTPTGLGWKRAGSFTLTGLKKQVTQSV